MAAFPSHVLTSRRWLVGWLVGWPVGHALAGVMSVGAALAGIAPVREPPVAAVGGPAAPRRIVSIIPATTEMLFAMGCGNRVVGVSSYDHYPPAVERLPRVGALLDPSVERILALKPDLVIVYETQGDLKQQLERAGIAFFSYAHRGVPDIGLTIRSLGTRVGGEPAAKALADRIERQLADIRARVAGRPRPKTLLVFGRARGSLRNIDASGGYGFLHDMLEIAGADNVLADVARQSVMMTVEMVLARAPEVIVEIEAKSPTPTPVALKWDQRSDQRAWRALPSVPAVQGGRLYLLQGEEFVVPGPRIALATERLARVIHPEVFR